MVEHRFFYRVIDGPIRLAWNVGNYCTVTSKPPNLYFSSGGCLTGLHHLQSVSYICICHTSRWETYLSTVLRSFSYLDVIWQTIFYKPNLSIVSGYSSCSINASFTFYRACNFLSNVSPNLQINCHTTFLLLQCLALTSADAPLVFNLCDVQILFSHFKHNFIIKLFHS